VAFAVHEPKTLSEALGVLAEEGDACAALAGGTDLLLRIRRRVRTYRSVVNIKCVPGLTGITDDREGTTIGALTTFRAIETHRGVYRRYPALVEAARVVAGVQLRNLATIGGNLGNASPSADSVPPLVALGAWVDIASANGTRTERVEDCIVAPGRTMLKAGEIFAAIRIPAPAPRSGNAFARFSPRSAMDIGIASVAVAITLDADGRCTACRIALGAVSPAPLRAEMAERRLIGERLTQALSDEAGNLADAAALPISDIRASADYRRRIIRVLASRMITRAASRAGAAVA
jgi:carbon-monoxide dehydrogenase medium subunit